MEEEQQQESSAIRSSSEEEGGSSNNDAASVVRSCDASSSSSMSALYHGDNNRSIDEASEEGGGGQHRVPMIPPVAAIAFVISLQEFFAPVVVPEPNIDFFFRHYLDDIDDDNDDDEDDDDGDDMGMEFVNDDDTDIDDDDVSAASLRRFRATLDIMEPAAARRASGRPFRDPPPEPSTNRGQQPLPPPRSGTPFQLFPVPPPFYDVDGVDDDLYAADWYDAGNDNNTSEEEEEGGPNASPNHLLPAYQHGDRLEHRLDRLRSNDPGTGWLRLSMSDVLVVYMESKRTPGTQEWDSAELPPLPPDLSLEMGGWEPLGSMYGPRLCEGLRCNTTVSHVRLDWDASAVVVARDDVRTRALHHQLSEMHNPNVSEIPGEELSDGVSRDFLWGFGQMVASLRNLHKLSIPSIMSEAPVAEGRVPVNYTHGAARVLEGAAHGVPSIELSLQSGARTRPSPEVLNRAPLRTEIATALARSHHSTLQVLDVHLGGNYHGEEVVGCFRAIFHVVPSLTSLVELTLENYVFHGDCSMTASELAACFQSKSLKSLVILDVQVSDDDLVEAAVQGSLANNATLEKFDLDFRSRLCTVTYDGLVRFVQGLAQNVTVKELVLPGRVPREAQKVLIKALQNVYGIKTFTFLAEPDPESDHAIKCLLAMNEAGRAYVKSQPTNLRKAIDVWQSVRDDLTSIFLHARENPLVFASLVSGSSSNARTTAALSHAAMGSTHRRVSQRPRKAMKERLRETEAELRETRALLAARQREIDELDHVLRETRAAASSTS